jgi:hypothetical protein
LKGLSGPQLVALVIAVIHMCVVVYLYWVEVISSPALSQRTRKALNAAADNDPAVSELELHVDPDPNTSNFEGRKAVFVCYALGTFCLVGYVCAVEIAFRAVSRLVWWVATTMSCRNARREAIQELPQQDQELETVEIGNVESREPRTPLHGGNAKWLVLGLFVSLTVGFFVTTLSLSHYMLLCNYKSHQFVRLCNFADHMRRDVERFIFEKRPALAAVNKSLLWLNDGALLAVNRAVDRANNCYIRNDHDFDMCIDQPYFSDMVEYFRSRRNHKYYFAYYSNVSSLTPQTRGIAGHPQKIRVYPRWSRLYTGHSGSWCVDIDECHFRTAPLEQISGCNGIEWAVTTKADTVAYFNIAYSPTWETPEVWNKRFACTHFGNW